MRPLIALLFACLTACSAAVASAAQTATPAELTHTVTALDAALFEAYNHCDLAKLATLVADDLEFYHDQTGLSRGKAVFLEAIRQNICGKVHRDLVPGTLAVYPLKGYGAVELGAHVFCAAQHSRCDQWLTGGARFVMLWKNEGGSWLLTRVISYDHEPAPAG
jgi:ketosteroid isomerase-like protein